MPPTRTASAPSASRTSILFPPGTTFRSAEDFVKQTHSRLAAEYGSGSRAPTKAGDALVIKCVPRQKIGCPFRVVAKEGRGKWQLVDAECRWYHDHGADGPVAKKKEQASIAQHAAPKGKGATLVGPTSRATPHNISRSPTKTKAKGQRSAYERVVLKQWPTPDLPRPGDRFPSSDAFMVAATIGVVPVYGTGIWNPFPLPSSYNINLSFLPALTSFLIGLNPTLESLAPHLLVAGVDSLSRLVQLSELDAFGLDAFLDAIAQNREALQAGGEGMAPATMLQLKMLRKGLLDSKAG
ncbi:hypothetical protein JCM10207_004021 [Rhodosporidiobolus poonsookiae]